MASEEVEAQEDANALVYSSKLRLATRSVLVRVVVPFVLIEKISVTKVTESIG